MKKVKDFLWQPGMTVEQCIDKFGSIGYQATELNEAVNVILNMKQSNSKIFLTFTSNMVTSGLRGFFAQLCSLRIPHVLITTSGAIEEDLMKSIGESFEISNFDVDDVKLHERGENRVGNLVIRNESYMKFEDKIGIYLEEIYADNKRISASRLLYEFGLRLKDENSILYQAAKNDISIYCPGIADSSLGFHLFLFQQKHPDFVVDNLKDLNQIISNISFDISSCSLRLASTC